MTTTLTESWYSGGFLVSEGNNYISRDQVTMVNSGTVDLQLSAGLVLAGTLSSGTLAPYTSASTVAAGILFNRHIIPAGGSARVTAITRQAEVNKAELQWDASILNAGTLLAADEAAAIASLGSLGIIAR